jgi:S-adenosylmethionine:tRNA ribosyltransferase-isomerase
MQRPQDISIEQYTYDLKDERIAKYPLNKRDESKLLHYINGQITDAHFKDLPHYIAPNSLVVFNNTKVIHARLHFKKESGTSIEIFCLEPIGMGYQEIFTSHHSCVWKCMLGNAKKWKGEILELQVPIDNDNVNLRAELLLREGQYANVKFTWDTPEINFGELLHHAGKLPLPPYLNRVVEEHDEETYQTLYAKENGSVAAPTAGLHFTEQVMESLKEKNIALAEVTLHVGAGTFMPVKADKMQDHEMHKETITISKELVQTVLNCLVHDRPIVAVGTTTLRTLESLYWYGVKCVLNQGKDEAFLVEQWDPYELEGGIAAVDAIKAVLNQLEMKGTHLLVGNTKLLIAPGYDIKMVKALITNFHQPNSTLLLLVAAFVGEDWRNIYAHALENNYRFLSFGDSSILWRN